MPADILRLDCHSRTTTSSTLFVLLRNDSGASYWLLVSPFAEDLGNKPHPPSRGARHPPPPHRAPRKQNLRGWILGRWAFIRPMRRIIVILPLLGGGINHPGPTTHKNCIFAGPGIVPPLRRGELRPRRERTKFPHRGEHCSAVVWVKPYYYGRRASADRNILCVPTYNLVSVPSHVRTLLTFCGLYATFWPRPHGGCLLYCARGAVRVQSTRYQPILPTLFSPFCFFYKKHRRD